MSTTATPPPAPAPAAPEPAVNIAGPGQPSKPFEYADNKDLPSGADAFDKAFGGKDEPAPSLAPSKEPVPAPTPPKEPSKPSFDDGLPTDTAKPAQEPAKPAAPEPKNAPELREAYYRSKEVIAAKEKELSDLRTQLASKPKAELNGEAEQYQTRIKELEGRLSERETELKFADYSRSDEYKETYEKPLESAVKTASEDIQSFTVTQADGTERPATLNDLRPMLNMKPGEAWKAAREIFGDAAPAIMRYRDQIVGLNQKAQSALEEFRTKGAERLKQTEQSLTAEETQAAQARIQTYEQHIGTRATQLPQLYGEDPADPEGNKLLQSGRQLVDIAFKGSDNLDDGDLVKIQAEVAARATGFGRMVHRNRTLQAKVDELTKKLAGYEKSEPKRGGRDGDVPAAEDPNTPSWHRAFDAIPGMR
jgi:hypothetical protein